jgi:fermentation-respiration switch protein FrsA (DUF1100 family)
MGVDVGSISPRSHSVDIPVLIIHGEGDTNVPVAMARELYAVGNPVNRGLELFPGADHAQSYLSDPPRYRRVVTEFIRSAEKL